MTRQEHLQFCKKCLNRKFDKQQGIICSITDKIADFESTCENFSLDATVKEEIKTVERSNVEIISELSEEIKKKLRPHQNLVYAVIGGSLLAFICALIWAAITVSTEYQIGFMAVGVGLVVGIGIRYFGAGIDKIFGYVGALLALIACLLGNLFSQVGFIAAAQQLGYFETLTYLDPGIIFLVLQESFNPIDLLFYGIAVYEGYRFAFRPIPVDIMQRKDLTPAYAKLRLPLVIISFIITTLVLFNISKGSSGYKTFYYESGNKLSEGELTNGKENGEWKYFYENGEIQIIASFANGIENGNWKWYAENGQLMREGNYENGLYHGPWINYYENGTVSDSSNYLQGRLQGKSVVRYENGVLNQRGEYVRDRQEGRWEFFHDNGNLSAQGNFKESEMTGLWEFWNPDGKKTEELEYKKKGDFSILNAWDKNGRSMVKNGNGTYQTYFENGKVAQAGKVTDGRKTGIWKSYHPNGKLKEEGEFKEDLYYIINTWTAEGAKQVVDGHGEYITYFENSTYPFEKGNISNGLRNGYWETYHENSIVVYNEANYKEGKLDGQAVTYYSNGNIFTEGEFRNGKKEGEWVWYYENGQMQCAVNFVNDKKEGSQTFWSESGQPSKEEVYENGALISEKIL